MGAVRWLRFMSPFCVRAPNDANSRQVSEWHSLLKTYMVWLLYVFSGDRSYSASYLGHFTCEKGWYSDRAASIRLPAQAHFYIIWHPQQMTSLGHSRFKSTLYYLTRHCISAKVFTQEKIDSKLPTSCSFGIRILWVRVLRRRCSRRVSCSCKAYVSQVLSMFYIISTDWFIRRVILNCFIYKIFLLGEGCLSDNFVSSIFTFLYLAKFY